MIVAHRGASRDAPENTLPAFKLAWEQQADAIEGDFRLTKDGRIVCIHDSDTKRVSNANLVVRHATLAELRRLDVGERYGEAFKGTVIPTIAEVFSTIPAHKTIYIEIKCGTEIIPSLLEEIGKSGLAKEQIVLISHRMKVIQALKEKAPQHKAFWLTEFKKNKEAVLKTLKLIKADGVGSAEKFIDEVFINRVKAEGYEYHVWTIDDAQTAKRFTAWGVGSITTNLPGYMRKILAAQDSAPQAEKSFR